VLFQKLLEPSFEKTQQQVRLEEDEAMRSLHTGQFLDSLARCFAVNADMISNLEDREDLTAVLVGKVRGVPYSLKPLVSSGVLATNGSFSCQVACRYNFTPYFPGRSSVMPVSLENLIDKAVASLSACRLNGCAQQDNELFSNRYCLAALAECSNDFSPSYQCCQKPEYRTRVKDFVEVTTTSVALSTSIYIYIY
jgi:hypothetical protein